MKKRLAALILTGNEMAYGWEKIPQAFLASKGVPADAKLVRRYHDVAKGVAVVAVVFEHASFAEIAEGARLPEIKFVQPAPEPPKKDAGQEPKK